MTAPARNSTTHGRAERVIAVVVTHNRPALLARCLATLVAQDRPSDQIIVVDNASGPETAAVLREAAVQWLRHKENLGGAGGFRSGIQAALAAGADWVWLMDDDGRPAGVDCLSRLLATAASSGAELIGPLVVDVDRPTRLSFPVRVAGRTLFVAADVTAHGAIPGFAHLFNGALIHAGLFARVGLPDDRLVIRGDEVEFLFRARRAGAVIVLDTATPFLHPGSGPEIIPILGGRFYAVVPDGRFKQWHQFRNRGYIFTRYGMWGWLAADVVRYGWYFTIVRRGDLRGLWRWGYATATGVLGRFMRSRR